MEIVPFGATLRITSVQNPQCTGFQHRHAQAADREALIAGPLSPLPEVGVSPRATVLIAYPCASHLIGSSKAVIPIRPIYATAFEDLA